MKNRKSMLVIALCLSDPHTNSSLQSPNDPSRYPSLFHKHYETPPFQTASFVFHRINITFPSMEALIAYLQQKVQNDDSSDGGTHSDIGFQMHKQKEATPFSSKHVCRESDTPHSKAPDSNEPAGTATVEDEKLLLPGDVTEMNKFCEEAEKSSKLQINVTLPVVSVQLK